MLTLFWRDVRAATAIEYALIGGMIFLAIVAAVRGIGPVLSAKFTAVATNLT